MRIALLSDIHGNDIALQAVLDDIKQQAVDRIVCLGDVATLGPAPVQTLQILRDLNCSCILGNHDAFLLEPELIISYTEAPEVVEAVDWCREQLQTDDFDFLQSFITKLEIEIDTTSSLLLYHGSPTSHMEEILATTPDNQLDQHIQNKKVTVMAGGHTHVQMLRQHKGVLLVNPGSVGYPFQEYVSGKAPTILAHAEYAIVEIPEAEMPEVEASKETSNNNAININLRRVNVDIEALKSKVSNCPYPMQTTLLKQYERLLAN